MSPASEIPARPARSASIWMRRGRWLAVVAAAWLSLGAVTGFAGRWWWGFELASHFRVQYFWGLLATALVLVFCQAWGWGAATRALAVVHGALLWPFYQPPPRSAAGGATFRVLSLNVLWSNPRRDETLRFVRKAAPDVAVFIEIDEAWGRALEDLLDEWPHAHTRAEPGVRGMALYSRLPIEELRVEFLSSGVPSIAARVSVEGAPVTIIGGHPYPPISPGTAPLRDRQLSALATFADSFAGERVLVGDLNATSWSPVFADLVDRTGLRDSRLGRGVQPSWPAWVPAPLRIPIDHCLVSSGISVQDRRIGPDIGSDHLPVLVDLSIP